MSAGLKQKLDRTSKTAIAPSRRYWTASERDILVRDYGRVPALTIAAELRRTVGQVYQQAATLGLCRHTRLDWSRLDGDLRRLHAEGFTDSEIARHLHEAHGRYVSRECVSERRRKLRLDSNAFSVRRRRTVAARTREQLARAGLKSLAEVRNVAWSRAAVRCGWPADLRPRAVQMLNVLYEHGPLTRRQIAGLCGMTWRGSRKSLTSNDPQGTYLANLMDRGLVLRLPRVVKKSLDGTMGKGKSRHLYMLAPGVAPNIQTQHTKTQLKERA